MYLQPNCINKAKSAHMHTQIIFFKISYQIVHWIWPCYLNPSGLLEESTLKDYFNYPVGILLD